MRSVFGLADEFVEHRLCYFVLAVYSLPDVVVECADINICLTYCSANNIKCSIWLNLLH